MEYFIAEGILDGGGPATLDLTDQIVVFLCDRLGLSARPLVSRLGPGATVETVSAEKRLGYSTNYNLIYEADSPLVAATVYGAAIVTSVGEARKLGEHLQEMIARLTTLKGVVDVRLSVSDAKREDGVNTYISVWGAREVVLSQVLLTGQLGRSMAGWPARPILNIVGRFVRGGGTSADLEFRAATFCNEPEDLLGADSASAASVVALSRDGDTGGVCLRLLPGYGERGPLAHFGILKGGSRALVDGKKLAVLRERKWEQEEAHLPGKEMAQERARTSPAERWPAERARKIREPK